MDIANEIISYTYLHGSRRQDSILASQTELMRAENQYGSFLAADDLCGESSKSPVVMPLDQEEAGEVEDSLSSSVEPALASPLVAKVMHSGEVPSPPPVAPKSTQRKSQSTPMPWPKSSKVLKAAFIKVGA